MIQAAAVVRGQIGGRQVPLSFGGVPIGRVGTAKVPEWVTIVPDLTNIPDMPMCSELRANGPASCELGTPHIISPSGETDTRTVLSASEFSNYPPLYYLIVGVPTLFSTGSGAQYGMRYTGALVDSVLIALGLFLLVRYHPRRLPLLGAMIALSPMVLFISAAVSSSGMETAAAFAAWCGGLCVVERTEIPRSLAAVTSLSFVVLILSRPISPINAAVIVLVLATSIGWDRSRALIRGRSCRSLWMSVSIATAVAGFFLVLFGFPTLTGPARMPALSFVSSVWSTLRPAVGQLRQCIGNFGWLDLPAPQWVIVVWISALAGLFAYGLAVSRRCRRALPLLALAMLAILVIFQAPEINTVGDYWSGRYWLPLAVGLPLVASSVEPHMVYQRARSAGRSALELAGFVSVGALLIVAQVAAFLTALHRYEGLAVKAGSPVKWTPPAGTTVVVSLFITGQILLLGLLTWKYLEMDRRSMVAKTDVRSSELSRHRQTVPT